MLLGLPTNAEHMALQETLPSPSSLASADATATGNQDSFKEIILRLTKAMQLRTLRPFILVGGASLILHGSDRLTSDLDLLISKNHAHEFVTAREEILGELTDEARRCLEGPAINLLHTLADRFNPITIESILPFVIELEGVRVPQLDVLLGAKVTSYNGRPDGEPGNKKRRSDLNDIDWISVTMKQQGLKVRKQVCDMFTCGPYHMLLVVEALYAAFDREGVEVFDSVGRREFECDWESEAFVEQAEYYQWEIEEAMFREDELELLQSRRKSNL